VLGSIDMAVAVALLCTADGVMLMRVFIFLAVTVTMFVKKEQPKDVGKQTKAAND
jgi:hypothetical protein